MNKLIKFSIFIFAILFISQAYVFAQNKTVYDKKSEIKIKDSKNIQKYLDDNYYKYNQEKVDNSQGFIQKIIYYLQRFLSKIFGYKHTSLIFYILVFSAMFFILIKLLGFKYNSMFFKNKNVNLKSEMFISEDELKNVDLDELIKQAVNQKNYNSAVRYSYLKYIKLLINKNIIVWDVNKTNTDYKKELFDTKFQKNFKELSFFFEYIWYGEFKIDETQFEYTISIFKNAYSEINEK